MTKIYNCSVINKYLIVGKHLLTTFLVILKSLKRTINIKTQSLPVSLKILKFLQTVLL
jgi:hypothetical protein